MGSESKRGRPTLTDRQWKRVVDLASNCSARLSIREIAEKARISESSVVRVLKASGHYPRKKKTLVPDTRRMTKQSSQLTLETVAVRAGVSRSTASLALRGSAKVASATRERVDAAAREVGYKAHPYVGALMASVRSGKLRPVTSTIAYLYGSSQKVDCFRGDRAKPYGPARRFDVAKVEAERRGFELEPFDFYEFGDNVRRQQEILYNRGVKGVLVDLPAYAPSTSGFDFNKFACVAFRDSYPIKMNVVSNDHVYNIQHSFRKLCGKGYRKIGYISFLSHALASYDERTSGFLHAQYQMTDRRNQVPPLPLDNEPDRLKQAYCEEVSIEAMFGVGESGWIEEDWKRIRADKTLSADNSEGLTLACLDLWLKRWKPDAIISELNVLVDWLEMLGYQVPKDIAVVHTDLKADVPDWAGIRRAEGLIGSSAVKALCDQIDLGQIGAPEFPVHQRLRGQWEEGWTVGSPLG